MTGPVPGRVARADGGDIRLRGTWAGCKAAWVLSDEAVEAFISDGFTVVRRAFTAEVAGACADGIWSALAERGVRREDPSTWTELVGRVPCPEYGPFIEAGTSRLLQEACDQLLAPGRWWRRRGVDGHVIARFPSERDPGDIGWHLDGGYENPADRQARWVTVRARGGGLLALFLFSDVDEDSAPTRLRAGSHLDSARVLAAAGEQGLKGARRPGRPDAPAPTGAPSWQPARPVTSSCAISSLRTPPRGRTGAVLRG
jgi:hypothetical protein